jgi:hypothetical protein
MELKNTEMTGESPEHWKKDKMLLDEVLEHKLPEDTEIKRKPSIDMKYDGQNKKQRVN